MTGNYPLGVTGTEAHFDYGETDTCENCENRTATILKQGLDLCAHCEPKFPDDQ